MLLPLAAFVVLAQTQTAPDALLSRMRDAVGTGSADKVKALFARPDGAEYLLHMAQAQGGMRSLKVSLFPVPEGWGRGAYWAIFHTYQDIEEHHDPVFEVVRTPAGLLLGPEVRESVAEFEPIASLSARISIDPSAHRADVDTRLALKPSRAGKAPIFRLNDFYRLKSVQIGGMPLEVVEADEHSVPVVRPGQVLRVGSLILPQITTPISSVDLSYTGTVDRSGGDQINEKACYLTAWWLPSTARLPLTTKITVIGPKDWEIRSEGTRLESVVQGDQQTTTYHCDLPISYPKVVAGKFRLAASKTVNGKLFRDYQLEPVDEARGQKVVDAASAAVAFDESKLAPFPFTGYDVFESDSYYGIESYSYTLLSRSIVLWATTHEIGHTYFGGMAPCPYVIDSWNEGLTQFWDSVVYKNDSDRSLERGLASVRQNRSLSQMSAPWDDGDLSYYRGAYVMRMLENEVGPDKVLAGLRALVTQRKGVSTTWADLRPIFEKAAGVPLDWFWDQWIDGAVFPQLEIVSASIVDWNGKKHAKVTVRQSGTPRLYRLRFKVAVSNGPRVVEQVVTMRAPEVVVDLPVDFVPSQAKVDVFGYALATVAGPKEIR